MLILVANLGSTSFKYRLFRMDENGGEVIAKGGYERVSDYAGVIDDALATLQRDCVIASPDEIEAVGFKTVLGYVDGMSLGLSSSTSFDNAAQSQHAKRGVELELPLPIFDWGGARNARSKAMYLQSAARVRDVAVKAR